MPLVTEAATETGPRAGLEQDRIQKDRTTGGAATAKAPPAPPHPEPAPLERHVAERHVAERQAAERQGNEENSALVAAHLAGDPRAFAQLVKRYETRLLNFVYRMIGDRERAEDLVQEAFIRVYRHLHRFDQSKKFSTWIYTIASNLAKNELRNRSRSPLVLYQSIKPRWEEDQRPLQFEDSTSRPDDMYSHRYLKELVDETVAKLSDHHREVFVLRELEGKSYEEIAEITKCNLGTVKSRLNRARHSFAQMIAPLLD